MSDGNRICGLKASFLKGTQSQGVCVSEDCCNKVPRIGWVSTTEGILPRLGGRGSGLTLAELVLPAGFGEGLFQTSLLAARVTGSPCSSVTCGCIVPISASVFTWPSSLRVSLHPNRLSVLFIKTPVIGLRAYSNPIRPQHNLTVSGALFLNTVTFYSEGVGRS